MWHFFALMAVLLTLSIAALVPRTFYSNDVGLRFLQARSLVANGWQTFAVSYPAESYDPDFAHVPYYYAYSIVDQEIFLSISATFPLLASLFYATFGWYGMAVPMVVGSLLTAAGVFILAKRSGLPHPHLWLWLAVFGTPVIFYTLQIWDHSMATGFTTLGVALTAVSLHPLNRRHQLLGGLLIALTFAQRPEMTLFAICAGLALLVVKRNAILEAAPFVVGGLAGTAVSFLLNWFWQGHPLGFPLASRIFGVGVPDAFPVQPYSEVTITPALKMGRLLFFIEARDPVTFLAAISVLVGVLLFFFGLRIERYRKTAVLWAAFVVTAVGYLLWAIVGWEQAVTGLISTLPILPLAIAVPKNSQQKTDNRKQITNDELSIHNSQFTIHNSQFSTIIHQYILVTTFLFVSLMVLIWPSFGGEQWGARYMLSAYPLLLYLAVVHLHQYQQMFSGALKQLVVRLTVGFVILLLLFQAVGVRLLFDRLYEAQAAQTYVAALEAEMIFTNHPFLPSFMTTLEDTQFFFVETEQELNELVKIGYEQGIRNIGVLTLEQGQLPLPEKINEIVITPIGRDRYRLSAAGQN